MLLAASTSPLAARGLSLLDDPAEEQRRYEPLPSLPESLNGIVRPQKDAPEVPRIDRIRDVFRAIQACWRPPRGSGYSGQELTIRLSFKRSGEVLGLPKITYYRAGSEPEQREPFTRSVREAFVRCTPLPFTDSLGGAVAGRPFVFRFVDSQPM
ncbi:hypothetical protein [Microvirga guangxiensis]|uniref:hypothetical protein n=1 Tax=Microvirga guangxiensis TaxID=549386 RepID=UPI000B81F2CC|nr:hypothetical protein [Microvirga guangxiensis]